MTVNVYTVSDASGNTRGDNKGEIVSISGDPFRFYVFNHEFNKDKEAGEQNSPYFLVQIVMPLGGTESGLFRFPRVGETVLVGTEGNVHYLMGYIPTYNTAGSQDFQTTGMSQADGRGEVFRYRQTGKKEENKGNEPYSEIGFYHKATSWKPLSADQGNYADMADDYPKIDHIKIQSTGDIHTRAQNHHRMKAKRIEILSNVKESDFSQELKGDNRPFGDKGADISELFQGDVHIRGDRRIVLKAGSEIRLEVGRSTIVISDAGIILTSRKTHSDIHNSLDTVLSILPRDGITMFGQHLKLAAAYDWSIAENMGATVKGTAGIMRMLGKDIKASTISGVAYVTNFIAQTLAFATNLTSMSVGTHDSGNVQQSALPAYAGMGVGVAGILTNVGIGLKYPESGEIDDPDSKIVKFGTLALQNLSMVLGVIETIYISPEGEEGKKGKDALALAGIIAEWGCLLPIFVAICVASGGPFMVHNDSVHLGNNGELTLLGAAIKNFAIDEKFVNFPLAGGVNFLPENKKWYEKLLDFVKAHWWQLSLGAIGVTGALVGLGFGASATLDRMTSLAEEKERLQGELNAL